MKKILEQLLADFIVIDSQPFLLGTPDAERSMLAKSYGGTRESYREESPQHRLVLPTFVIARTPVTNALYAQYCAETGAAAPLHWHGKLPAEALHNHPAVNVSWHAAQAFCGWLTSSVRDSHVVAGLAGRSVLALRLPSEAEWELAARGSDGRSFPWGNEWQPGYANTRESGLGQTEAVGSYPQGASPYGCLDMAGNVWEWTASLDHLYPYDAADGREDAEAPGRRILRGGCYANPQGYARCACRFRLAPSMSNEFLGFRLAATLQG